MVASKCAVPGHGRGQSSSSVSGTRRGLAAHGVEGRIEPVPLHRAGEGQRHGAGLLPRADVRPGHGPVHGQGSGGDGERAEPYGYAGGSPLSRTDPCGMRFSENDPFENPFGTGGNGPTCPPGNNGHGNAYGHCGAALTSTPKWQTLECYTADTLSPSGGPDHSWTLCRECPAPAAGRGNGRPKH